MQPTYDISKSTHWNQENGPLFEGNVPKRTEYPNPTKLWNFDLNSPLGIPAGPLFNSKFIKLYADLGYDTLVYKTVRSVERQAHPNPNIVFVDKTKITRDRLGEDVNTIPEPENIEDVTITNSYGVNSLTIEGWQADFAKAKAGMNEGQLLILSCMGTHGIDRELVEDYVYTASAAKDAGAQAIELNFSCPNLKGAKTGAIYMDPEISSEITQKVKAAIGDIPLIIKLGHYEDRNLLNEILRKNAPHVDGVAAINTIKMKVYTPDGQQALPGEGRLTSGLCGSAILPFALETVQKIAEEKNGQSYNFEILGVGGITSPEDIDKHLEAGAKIAMTGTAAMWDPLLAYKYNQYKLNH